ncbi:hypothetical protein N0V90_001682 [Kalmusia sp. IMI 367209]|nr:hypothetical protein N0V90_001682 [Kalmusia sp. IMI 367209]
MLLKRLDGTIALHNSRMMTQISRLTNNENAMMRELTEKATKDADAVKWLTFITLIYLPASFVATMMGMGYINVRKTSHFFAIHFTGEFWIFFVLTMVFLIMTMALYFYFIRRNWLRGNRVSEDQVALKSRSSSSN